MSDAAAGWVILGGLILLGFLLWDSLMRVPRGQAVIMYRRGRFLKVLTAGLHFRTPLIDWVRESVALGTHSMRLDREPCARSDSSILEVTVTVIYTLIDVENATTTIVENDIQSRVRKQLCSIIAGYRYATVLIAEKAVAGDLSAALEQELAESGLRVDSVLVDGIQSVGRPAS